ncbi:hypothetical protein WH47_00905 [Habropoda laboriosa]|uniref:Uncharacterized protein n=1 Tax=Habropoda laboriosa TaxID=597456 RepID=A0A0L7RK28_9HYME|nr:hypothetical protein WH47_00905 [Habropoda laboriosa]
MTSKGDCIETKDDKFLIFDPGGGEQFIVELVEVDVKINWQLEGRCISNVVSKALTTIRWMLCTGSIGHFQNKRLNCPCGSGSVGTSRWLVKENPTGVVGVLGFCCDSTTDLTDRETGVEMDKDRSRESGGNGKFVESGAVRPRANLNATCALLRLLEDGGKS